MQTFWYALIKLTQLEDDNLTCLTNLTICFSTSTHQIINVLSINSSKLINAIFPLTSTYASCLILKL